MANKTDLESNKHIGHLLQEAREKHWVMQYDIAKATGMTPNHISAIERGVSKASIDVLNGYCRRLNMTPNEILGYDYVRLIPELKELLDGMSEAEQRKVAEIANIVKNQ